MKKAMRKLIPAVVMLLISAMLVGTSTYAWFSMNKTVTVTGMTVKAKGTDNVMIANASDVDTELDASRTAETQYGYGIDQVRKGNLQPASTIDGVDYFYTAATNVNANGSARTANYSAYDESTGTALANSGADKAKYDAGFNTNYGVTGSVTTDNVVYAYIDYSFYIKVTNAGDSAKSLIMSRCNLLYNNAAVAGDSAAAKAWRVALFAKKADNEGVGKDVKVTDDVAVGNLKTIIGISGAAYFTTGQAVDAAPSTLASVTNLDAGATIGSISAGKTDYYKVTVRLWLEGEDTTCNNDTFASLTDAWSLDLAFSMGEGSAVDVIGSSATATISGTGNSRTAALSVAGETAASYLWYKVGSPDAAAEGTNDEASYTASASGNYYCVITTQKGSKYRTATVNITVAP